MKYAQYMLGSLIVTNMGTWKTVQQARWKENCWGRVQQGRNPANSTGTHLGSVFVEDELGVLCVLVHHLGGLPAAELVLQDLGVVEVVHRHLGIKTGTIGDVPGAPGSWIWTRDLPPLTTGVIPLARISSMRWW